MVGALKKLSHLSTLISGPLCGLCLVNPRIRYLVQGNVFVMIPASLMLQITDKGLLRHLSPLKRRRGSVIHIHAEC